MIQGDHAGAAVISHHEPVGANPANAAGRSRSAAADDGGVGKTLICKKSGFYETNPNGKSQKQFKMSHLWKLY
jgi:hypothetical protein